MKEKKEIWNNEGLNSAASHNMTLEKLSSDETKSSGTTDEMQQWYSEHARACSSTVRTFDQFGAPESQQHFSSSYSEQYYHTDPTTMMARTGCNTTNEVSIESVSGAIDLMEHYFKHGLTQQESDSIERMRAALRPSADGND